MFLGQCLQDAHERGLWRHRHDDFRHHPSLVADDLNFVRGHGTSSRNLSSPAGHDGTGEGAAGLTSVLCPLSSVRGARSGYAAENLAQTRRMAIHLLRQDKTCKRGIKGKLLRAALDPDYLKALLKN